MVVTDEVGVESGVIDRFPVIVGPTASGKTGVGVALAHLLRERGSFGEVVTADSMQVYRGMDVGTAKPSVEEREGVPHHLIDLVEPSESYSVDQWLRAAEACIADVRGRGGVPIVVGGTHLYIKALLDGLFEGPRGDEALRAELAAMSAADRRAELERVDPAAAARIHPNDDRRTIRAIEVYRLTGTPISAHQAQWDKGGGREDCRLFALHWETEALNRRINARVKQMVGDGLVEEVRELWEAGALGPQAREGLGYKQLIEHFEGRCTLEEALEQVKIETRRFGKNQRTWLRRLMATPGAVRVGAGEKSPVELAEGIARALDAPPQSA